MFGILTRQNDVGVPRMIRQGFAWCADNGMFTGAYREIGRPQLGRTYGVGWLDWLEQMSEFSGTCKFVLVPDVIGNAAATVNRYKELASSMREFGLPLGFAAQDGQENIPLPNDYNALFIGGSTKWKLGPGARRLMLEAQSKGKWVHMGRVNSRGRIAYCRSLGIDSVDGTHVIFAPDQNIPKIRHWMTVPMLFEQIE